MRCPGRIVSRGWSGAVWLLLFQAARADDLLLAQATAPTATPSEITLYLDLTVNGAPAGTIVPVQQLGHELRVRTEDLRAAGVRIDLHDAWLSLDRTPGVTYHYDTNRLSLDVTVPAEWFEAQRLGDARSKPMDAVSGAGFVLNYSAHVVDRDDQATIGTLWSEMRLFDAYGVWTSTGMQRFVESDDGWYGSNRRGRYVRFDTAWTTSNEDQLRTWTFGDLITPAQSWSTPVRIAGIKLARDFRLRPDVITYPLPEFSGQAALPSTLDVFVNGHRVRSEQLRPGPYTVTSIPFVTGAGEAKVVTTDVLGRSVETTLPFYASSELLRAGFTDYALSIGALRRDYGLKSFSYGRLASAGSLRHGLTNAVTLETQAELALTDTSTLGLLGVGAVANIGLLGVVNGSVSHSTLADRSGWQWTFGYHYSNCRWNVGYQNTRRSRDFVSLANIETTAGWAGATSSDVFSLGLSTDRYGSASLSVVRVQPAYDVETRLMNVSYFSRLSDALNLRLSASRDLRTDEDLFGVQVFAWFGRRHNLSVGVDGSSGEYLRYTRSVPSEGGLGWNVGHTRSGSGRKTSDASLAWSGRYVRAEAGVTTDWERTLRWADLRGSLLIMDEEVFAARQVSDAFVVVSTNGIADVPVRYENQLVGYTNRNGRLLVPWVASHYAAKFSIDATDLPPEIAIDESERRMVVKRGSGATLRFDMQRINAALLQLVERDGAFVPVGSQVQDSQSEAAGMVGYDGLVYLENLTSQVDIEVRRPDGTACRVTFDHPSVPSAVMQLGPFTCEPVL